MDICVINPYFYPYATSGTEKMLLNLYGRLSKKHNITVITSTLRNKGKPLTEEIKGIQVIRLRTKYIEMPHLPLPFMVMDGIKEQIGLAEADIYHMNNRFVYYTSTMKAIKNTGSKFVLTLHNARPQNIDPLTDFGGMVYDSTMGYSIMKAADAITGVSKATLDTTVPNQYASKTTVITNGVDFKSFRPRNLHDKKVAAIADGLNLKGTTLINNARLVRQKGHKYLVKSIAGLNAHGNNVSLLIIGRGPDEEGLRSLISKLGLNKRVKIITGISESELPYYYNACGIFAFPSLYEPAGMALLEGMASQMPCIGSMVGGIPEILKSTGFFVEPRSHSDISARVEEIINNHDFAKKMAEKSRQLVIKEHNWDNIAKQYETLFSRLLKG